MKFVGRLALAAAAAAGLVFGTSVPAGADHVRPHKHCLLTPTGWVPIASGVSDYAPLDPALENFHVYVHTGQAGEQVVIWRIVEGQKCSDLPTLTP
jgi:hypothetical protein